MASATTMASPARHQMTSPWADATAVPTRTGTMAAGRVRGRAPATQRLPAISNSSGVPCRQANYRAVPKLVAIDATGGPSFVDRLRAAWDAGDAVLPVDPRLPSPARQALLDAVGARRPVTPGDAVVVATSGTTGDPKGVVLTHVAVAASAQATSIRLEVDPNADRWLACLPLAHVGGLSVVMRARVTGTPLTVHDGFDAASVEQEAR